MIATEAVIYQVEPWSQCLAEMQPLWQQHWEEIALNKDIIKPDADLERYARLEAMNQLHVTTVREDGRLVGYVVCFIVVHMHYKSAGEMALADMYWLAPEYRKGVTGIRLFQEMEKAMRARGVVRMHLSCKRHFDQTRLFERLGYQLTDLTFGKVLCQ